MRATWCVVFHFVTWCFVLLELLRKVWNWSNFSEQTTPSISFVQWSPRRCATMLSPFAQLFQHCWGDARALQVVSLNIIHACHSISGSCTLPLTPSNNSQHSRANTVGRFSNVLTSKQSSYIQIFPFSLRLAPTSESPLSPWSFSCFNSGLSPILLNQNITRPFIDVQELPQSQTNFTLALSLKVRHPWGMGTLVGSSFHLSGLKSTKIWSNVSCQCCAIFKWGVSSSSEVPIFSISNLEL